LETVWGFGTPVSVSDSIIISRRIWAHRRALVEKAAEHMGQINFFVFFNIGEGGGRLWGGRDDGTMGFIGGGRRAEVGEEGAVGGMDGGP
jgi:hypothetical protein